MTDRERRRIGGEAGFTLVEVMVTLMIGMVVFFALFALIDATARNSARTTTRVAADQRARPVLQRLVDELHSTCLGPDAGPILAGSSGSSLSFLHQTGSAVSPMPNRNTVTLSGTTLTESIYPATGGTAPDWTFSSTPSSTRQLLTGVGPGIVEGSAVPLFRYFSYVDGQLSPTPLPTPLSVTNAELTVQVTVAFAASPTSNPVSDPRAALTVSDSALVRFSPASEDPTKVNGPCV